MNKELIEKWSKYGILKGIDEDYKGILAQVLENQRMANEGSIYDATFKRLSIGIVRTVFEELRILNKLISIQPIANPAGLIHYISNNKKTIRQVPASTYKTKTVWNIEYLHDLNAGMRMGMLDAEVELMAILSQDLHAEIERKVLRSIKDGAAVKRVLMFTNSEEAKIEILDFIEEIKKLYHRPKANWIVTTPKIALCLFNSLPGKQLGLTYWGAWEDINIYIDSLFPTGRMLIGYKGEIPFDAGYVYSPYVPLGLSPVELNPDDFSPRKFILHQASHQMVDNTYYAHMEVVNFKED